MSRGALLLTPLILALVSGLVGYLVEVVAPHNYNSIDLQNRLTPPNPSHLLGTDWLGRDVLVRLLKGLSNSITVSIASVSLSITAALIAAVLSAVNDVIAVVVDSFFEVLYALPVSIAAFVLAFTYGSGVHVIFIAQTLALLPWFFRTLKTISKSITSQPYFEAARAIGIGTLRAAFKYVGAGAVGEVLALFSYGAADAIMLEASLSFLGLGFRPPEPSLGVMIYEGTQYVLQAPHIILASASFTTLLILTFNLIGDNLRNSYVA